MDKNYPLYPELSEEAAKQAQELLEDFKKKMLAVCEETLSALYTDVSAYIESDQWTNFRNEILTGMCNYNNRKIQGEYDFKKIRQSILASHREEIISDLNQDMLSEIAALKKEIEQLYEMRRRG
jgi:hypothetical protein